MKSKCHKFLVRQKSIHFLKYICCTYYLYICIQKLFYYTCEGLRKNIDKKGDGEIGKHNLNEIGALNMKFKK